MMQTESPESLRLLDALHAVGLGNDAQVGHGTGAVASPTRLATEWAGFVVAVGAQSWYAKVLHDDMKELIDVARTVDASRCAAQAEATVALRIVDMQRGVLLFDRLEASKWRWARVDDLASPERLDALWAAKRQVHDGPAPMFVSSPMDDIARLRALCRRDAVELPIDGLRTDDCIDRAWNALQASDVEVVPLHGDGLASNVMVGPRGELKLIDFDYGGCGDPWYDVAITLNELYQFEPQWREGIVRWAGRCDEADYARCRLYALVNDWYWTLWGLWLGTTSPRRLEFTKLAQWTSLRCRQGIQDARFEGWLHLLKG
ncbi:phosphotransferase [Paraburkholderia sp. CI3]|uniref:phosphotransferase n=1 Tax=Paraburkholderia sp. CI3 TaxID=2991060 RepID=UPI003D247881